MVVKPVAEEEEVVVVVEMVEVGEEVGEEVSGAVSRRPRLHLASDSP